MIFHRQRKRLILLYHPLLYYRLHCHRRFLPSWSMHFCKCSNLRRAWCIFESYVCIDNDFPITIILPERARRFLVNFEIETLGSRNRPKMYVEVGLILNDFEKVKFWILMLPTLRHTRNNLINIFLSNEAFWKGITSDLRHFFDPLRWVPWDPERKRGLQWTSELFWSCKCSKCKSIQQEGWKDDQGSYHGFHRLWYGQWGRKEMPLRLVKWGVYGLCQEIVAPNKNQMEAKALRISPG